MLVVKAATAGMAFALALGGAVVLADTDMTAIDPGMGVSSVARSSTSGDAHGDAVSAAARAKTDVDKDNDVDTDTDNDDHGSAISAIASGWGATISALAHSTTGDNKGATISAMAQTHGAKVSAAAKAK
jgi:hypothetical protein